MMKITVDNIILTARPRVMDRCVRMVGEAMLRNGLPIPRAVYHAQERIWTCGQDCILEPQQYSSLLSSLLPVARSCGAAVAVRRSSSAAAVRAVAFDLDSTLIRCEFMNLLARERGVSGKVDILTEKAMDGEMDFSESYRHRLALIAGLPVTVAQKLIDSVPITPGAGELLTALSAQDCATALISGGYLRLGEHIQRKLRMDFLYTSDLEERNGCLTGRINGRLLDSYGKAAALEDFCRRCDCSPMECAAVGDGANDIPMLAEAGKAVLYCSTPSCPEGFQPIGIILRYLSRL